MVQVAGSLNTPAYRWPLNTGITLCVLAPITYGLQELGWKGVGRLRVIVAILMFLGPIGLLSSGVVSLIFALAVRQARMARRRDLDDLSTGFALIDRRGRREYQDVEVVALGFRSRSAAAGTVTTQKGRATLWVDGPEGFETIALDWEYPDGESDPLAGFLGRLTDAIHARSVRTIDTGGTIDGEGWALSRQGLQIGDAFDILPFAEVAAAEYHDAQLQVWRVGQVEPHFKIAEGSRNEVILFAILNQRKPVRSQPAYEADPSGEGLGRILFERRPTRSEKFALWLLAVLISSIFIGLAVFATQEGSEFLVGLIVSILVVLSFLPAVSRQRSYFRFHERGVVRSGIFGIRILPYEDLKEVKMTLMSHDSQLHVVFKPIRGRVRKKVAVMLKPTDAAIDTIRAYIPAEKIKS